MASPWTPDKAAREMNSSRKGNGYSPRNGLGSTTPAVGGNLCPNPVQMGLALCSVTAEGAWHRPRVHANLRASPGSGYTYKLIYLFILIKNSFQA